VFSKVGCRNGAKTGSSRLVTSHRYLLALKLQPAVAALTSETIASEPNAINGAVSYTYDSVGNRKQLTSSLPPVPAGLLNYDANDRRHLVASKR
jgi:hypothetical protein